MKLTERTRLRWITARQASLSARRAFGAKCSWKFLSNVDLPDSDCPVRPSYYDVIMSKHFPSGVTNGMSDALSGRRLRT